MSRYNLKQMNAVRLHLIFYHAANRLLRIFGPRLSIKLKQNFESIKNLTKTNLKNLSEMKTFYS